MKLTIGIEIDTSKMDVDKIIQLLQLIREFSPESGAIISSAVAEAKGPLAVVGSPSRYLGPPPELENLKGGKVVLDSHEAKYVGTWGQFNSFFPVKAVLRILTHMVKENDGKPVDLEHLVKKSVEVFTAAGLSNYRGFPTNIRKESAIGRLVWHFIIPAHQMGLVGVEGKTAVIPTRAWGEVSVFPTREGLEFTRLENLVFEGKGKAQLLSEPERKWVLEYLKKIDGAGYKEYTFLKRTFDELKKGNTNLSAWLEKDEHFINYVKSRSTKKKDPRELKKQIANVATMFAQSKIALLRELGVISDKRNDYTVIGKLE